MKEDIEINELEVYKLALELFKIKHINLELGFCAIITHSILILYYNISKEDIIKYISLTDYPFQAVWESVYDPIYNDVVKSLKGYNSKFRKLYYYNPKNNCMFWFDPCNSQKRIRILEEIIYKLSN